MSDPLVNLEAEAELLGTLMFANEAIDSAADRLSSDDFAEPVHSRIFSAIVHEASLGRSANAITLKGHFQGDEALNDLGGPAYLARLTGACSTGLLATNDCIRLVGDLAERRRMRDGLAAAAAACTDMAESITGIIDIADAALSKGGGDGIHQPTGGECLDELIQDFEDASNGLASHAIPELDHLLGAVRAKQLIICAARPGMGKTALALSYALGASRAGHGVLFVSLEMSSRELAARLAADMCYDGQEGVPFAAISAGRLNDWQRRKLFDARNAIATLPFQVVDAGSLSTGRLNMLIRRHARRMKARGHKLELVVVDYLQLLRPNQRGRSKYEDISEVSQSLKAMAKDHDVAVMALAQLSREVEKRPDKRPQLADLRDSGQIEQDADAVLFLLRNEYYLRQSEPELLSPDRNKWELAMSKVQGKIEFILAKRRNGTTGSAVGAFYGAYQAVR
mgnify:CR=1 FL=1